MEFERALFVPPGETRVLQTTLRAHDAGGWRFDVHAGRWDGRGTPDDWTRLAGGRVLAAGRDQPNGRPDLAGLRARPLVARDPAALYDGFRAHGIVYGPSFARIEALWQLDDWEALARISGSGAGASSGLFDPGVLDACLQPMGLTISTAEATGNGHGSDPAFLPARIRRAHIAASCRRASGVTSPAARRRPPSRSKGTSRSSTTVAGSSPRYRDLPSRPPHRRRPSAAASEVDPRDAIRRRAAGRIVAVGPEAIGWRSFA